MPTRKPRSSGYSTQHKLARREAKAQRKRDGLCIACPMKALSGLVRCAACHDKQTERDRTRGLKNQRGD